MTGAIYAEMERITVNHADFGLVEDYDFKYPQHIPCYGWYEDYNEDKVFLMSPEIYPSYFNENVVHFIKES
jgi:hypothetical protein